MNKEQQEEKLLEKRENDLEIEKVELLRLRKIARGGHKWHESRMRAEAKFQAFVEGFNIKVRKLNEDIDRHNELFCSTRTKQ